MSSMMGKWSTGVCGCFGDCGTCCLTCWCPCITFGRIAEIVDQGSSSCCMHGTLYVLLASIGCNWLYSCTKRSSMRAQYNVPGSPFMDCCVHMFCESCALCQEYKELENRGFNMSKGWKGSNEMVLSMAAPEKQGMEVLLDHE